MSETVAPFAKRILRAHKLPTAYPDVMSPSSWARILAEGKIPSRLVGRMRLVLADDVERFLIGGSGA